MCREASKPSDESNQAVDGTHGVTPKTPSKESTTQNQS